MISIFKDSLLYRFFAAIGRWFSGQWLGSRIIWLLSPQRMRMKWRSCIFTDRGRAARRAVVHIPRVETGPRFRRQSSGASVLVVFSGRRFAPVLPTMALLGVVLISG